MGPGLGNLADTTDEHSNYNYRGGQMNRPDLVDELDDYIEGEVRFDEHSRQLYATDASIYACTPIGVVFPRSTTDVATVIEYCAGESIPVLPRGGGTSLAGQSVNEAVVLDFTRHMDSIVEFSSDERRARAQPGIRLGDLNATLAEEG